MKNDTTQEGRRLGDANFSQRELRYFFGEINGKLDAVVQQTTKTNGRVNDLEQDRDQMKGAMKIITYIFVPVILYIIYQVINKSFA